MSFKCHFDVDGGVEKHAWLPSHSGPETYIECEPFTVYIKRSHRRNITKRFLARDVTYTSRALVSVCLSVCPSVCDGSALAHYS